jgi:hypothetical protein
MKLTENFSQDVFIIVMITIIGSTALSGPWPSLEASSELPYLIPVCSNCYCLQV